MRRARIALVVTGALVTAYALIGVLTGPIGVLIFLAAVVAVHDGIWLPLVHAAGGLINRWTGERLRPAVRITAIALATVTIVALPLVLGFGDTPDNPSVLPQHYGRNLVVLLTVIVAATVAASFRRTGKGRTEKARTGKGRTGKDWGKERSTRRTGESRKEFERPDHDGAGDADG